MLKVDHRHTHLATNNFQAILPIPHLGAMKIRSKGTIDRRTTVRWPFPKACSSLSELHAYISLPGSKMHLELTGSSK
jgi:hypothetical protein